MRPATTPHDFKRWVTHVQSPHVEQMLKEAASGPVISFAGALPAEEFFPTEAIEAAFEEVIAHNSGEALQYCWCDGYEPLRRQIAERMGARGIAASPDEVLVTHGAQQALDLLGKLTVRTGATVGLETPTYSAAIQAFELQRPVLAGIPRSDRALDLDALEELLERHAPKLLYLVPTGHNPTGGSLTRFEREQVVALTRGRGVLVIEDDAYGDLQYDAVAAPLQALADAREHVVYVGSFSKILSPGLRVGWIVARRDIIAELAKIKQASDLQTGSLNQLVLSRYLEQHDFGAHIRSSVDAYRVRRDATVAALQRHLPAGIPWTRAAAGFSVWVQLPAVCDCDAFLKEAIQHGVAFEPGKPFFPEQKPAQNCIRLSFSNHSAEEIDEGVRRLGELAELSGERADACTPG